MSTELEAVHGQVRTAVSALVKTDVLRKGSDALAAIKETPSIIAVASDEDVARAGDLRLELRKAVKHVETGITDLFRPQKMFQKMLKEHFDTQYISPMDAAVKAIDDNLKAWDTEKMRRAAEERERVAREQAAIAAAAAAETARLAAEAEALREKARQEAEAGNEAAANTLFDQAEAVEDDAPPTVEAQVIVAAPIREAVKGAEATTYLVRKLVCVLEDRAAAMRAWPEAFDFNDKACPKMFDAEGHARPADNANVLVGGVRFTVEVSIGGRGR